eukprot:Nk52_evm29s215 gene=Nk52_evmTU29s215
MKKAKKGPLLPRLRIMQPNEGGVSGRGNNETEEEQQVETTKGSGYEEAESEHDKGTRFNLNIKGLFGKKGTISSSEGKDEGDDFAIENLSISDIPRESLEDSKRRAYDENSGWRIDIIEQLQQRNFFEGLAKEDSVFFEYIGKEEEEEEGELREWEVFADHDIAVKAFKDDLERRLRLYEKKRKARRICFLVLIVLLICTALASILYLYYSIDDDNKELCNEKRRLIRNETDGNGAVTFYISPSNEDLCKVTDSLDLNSEIYKNVLLCKPKCNVVFSGFTTVLSNIAMSNSRIERVLFKNVTFMGDFNISNNPFLVEIGVPMLRAASPKSQIAIYNNTRLEIIDFGNEIESINSFIMMENPSVRSFVFNVVKGSLLKFSKMRMEFLSFPLAVSVESIVFKSTDLPHNLLFRKLESASFISFQRCLKACDIAFDSLKEVKEIVFKENTYGICGSNGYINFPKLDKVGQLTISSNLGLKGINITNIVTPLEISIEDNFSLVDVLFPKLSIVLTLIISRNPYAENIDLSSLKSVVHWGYFDMLYNLVTLDLPQLKYVGLLNAQFNMYLQKINLPQLVEGSIVVLGCISLRELEFPNLKRANRIIISNNTNLLTVRLPKLTSLFYTNIYHSFVNTGAATGVIGGDGIAGSGFSSYKYQNSLFNPLPSRPVPPATFTEYLLNGAFHVMFNDNLIELKTDNLTIGHGDLIVSHNRRLGKINFPKLITLSMLFLNNNANLTSIGFDFLQTIDSVVLPLSTDKSVARACSSQRNVFTGDGLICVDEFGAPITPKIVIVNCTKLQKAEFPSLFFIRDVVQVVNNTSMDSLVFSSLYSLRQGDFRNNNFTGDVREVCSTIFPSLILDLTWDGCSFYQPGIQSGSDPVVPVGPDDLE